MSELVLIVEIDKGIGASLVRLCLSKGTKVILEARNIEKLEGLKQEVELRISIEKF